MNAVSPGLLSGIALAVSDDDQSPQEDGTDGFLTACEVLEMDLRAVDLVVLAACESGLGSPFRGEGTLGIQRALQVAGAGTVVSTNTLVDDEATQVFMRQFYRHMWAEGKSPLQALRATQMDAIGGLLGKIVDEPESARRGSHGLGRRLRSPHCWAAFTVAGDWR